MVKDLHVSMSFFGGLTCRGSVFSGELRAWVKTEFAKSGHKVKTISKDLSLNISVYLFSAIYNCPTTIRNSKCFKAIIIILYHFLLLLKPQKNN